MPGKAGACVRAFAGAQTGMMKRPLRILAACLGLGLPALCPAAEWKDLFDGSTLNGWDKQTRTNWRVENGAIVADSGEKGLLTTGAEWSDCEIEVEFRAAGGTRSGVMLSTRKTVTDPATECYELNIAPDSEAYPTGSLAGRSKAPAPPETTDWQRLRARIELGTVKIWLNDRLVVEYKDRHPLKAGPVGLEFDQGKIEFRKIRLKNLSLL